MSALPVMEVYEVGGSLRDHVLGREPKEIDFMIRGHPVEELRDLLAVEGRAEELTVAGRLVGIRFWPSWGPREGIEVVVPRRERPLQPGEPGYTGNPHTDFAIEPDAALPVERDLERRDFTVNAMARDLRSGEWIDPFDGRSDARARLLRAVHPDSFRDDPLRVLRGVARRARDRLVPDDETFSLMRSFAPRIAGLSVERVRHELERTLEGEWAADGLRLARDVGALEAAVPELAAMVGIEQESRTQAYTLDEHALHTLEEACGRTEDPLVRLAALWHDVGKPVEPRDHAEAGARIAESALRRLTYDGATIRAVRHLIAEHAYAEDQEPDATGARRFLARVGREHARRVLLLRRCDRAARGVQIPADQARAREEFEALVQGEWERPVTLGELTLTGDDLIAAGVPQGPRLGRVLTILLAEVVEQPSLNVRVDLLARARELVAES